MTEPITRKRNLHESDNSTDVIEHHLSEGLANVMQKEPDELTDGDRQGAEREIRRWVKRDGGFRKGETLAKKKEVIALLDRLGRVDKIKALELLDEFEKLSFPEKRSRNEEFNVDLAGVGVAWDDQIAIPGFAKE